MFLRTVDWLEMCLCNRLRWGRTLRREAALEAKHQEFLSDTDNTTVQQHQSAGADTLLRQYRRPRRLRRSHLEHQRRKGATAFVTDTYYTSSAKSGGMRQMRWHT